MPETGEDIVPDKPLEDDADESETVDVVTDSKLVRLPEDDDGGT